VHRKRQMQWKSRPTRLLPCRVGKSVRRLVSERIRDSIQNHQLLWPTPAALEKIPGWVHRSPPPVPAQLNAGARPWKPLFRNPPGIQTHRWRRAKLQFPRRPTPAMRALLSARSHYRYRERHSQWLFECRAVPAGDKQNSVVRWIAWLVSETVAAARLPPRTARMTGGRGKNAEP